MANVLISALTDAWNSAVTTFTAIRMNVADSGSAADSRLISLQVNSAEKFAVDKAGNVTFAGALALSTALPISSGGTGGNTALLAKTNLGLEKVNNTTDAEKPVSTAQADALVAKAGARMTGSLSSAVKAHGSKSGTVTEPLLYSEGNTHSITIAGTITIDPQGLAEGDVMQVNVLYQSGTLAVAGTTQWELGGGQKSTALADLGITLAAGTVYRLMFEVAASVRTGVFQ